MTAVPPTQPPAAPETDVSAWQEVWQTLADHQWSDWECSCGGARKGSGEYEDNHLADVLSAKIATRHAALLDALDAARERVRVVEGERDDIADRLSALLCDLTGGLMSKTNYPVSVMVQAVEAEFEKHATTERCLCAHVPSIPGAYPCAHNHAHCDAMGCVGHVDGMHTDARGDVISHIGCDLCRPASPPAVAATTGMSEDVEALAREVCPCNGSAHDPQQSQECAWALRLTELVLASDWLAAREAAARAEERERIAQAIEAERDLDPRTPFGLGLASAAQIAREAR